VYSYYRFVLEPELEFTEDSGAVSGPFAQFDGLPLKPLLTLGMDPPESWLVESVHAVYDLDNICMNEVIVEIESIVPMSKVLSTPGMFLFVQISLGLFFWIIPLAFHIMYAQQTQDQMDDMIFNHTVNKSVSVCSAFINFYLCIWSYC